MLPATRHLIDLGHSRIVHIAGPQDWNEAEERMRGFLAEMSDADMPTVAPVLGDWTAGPQLHVLHVPAAPMVDLDELDDRELELLAAGSSEAITIVIVLCIVA